MPSGFTVGWLAGRISSFSELVAFVVDSLIGLALLPKALDATDALIAMKWRRW